MNLDNLKDLSDELKKAVMELHDADITALKESNFKLLSSAQKIQDEKNKETQDKIEVDKVQDIKNLDDMKKLLTERDIRHTELEQKILDDEKKRVDVENSRTIGNFVDKFISKNVVDDSLVRGAIKRDISKTLSVRHGKVLEINGSNELTGRTGDQVLSDAKINSAYKSHLIASRAFGGGSTGGTGNGDSNVKTMTREEYDTGPLENSAQFLRDGGIVVH